MDPYDGLSRSHIVVPTIPIPPQSLLRARELFLFSCRKNLEFRRLDCSPGISNGSSFVFVECRAVLRFIFRLLKASAIRPSHTWPPMAQSVDQFLVGCLKTKTGKGVPQNPKIQGS